MPYYTTSTRPRYGTARVPRPVLLAFQVAPTLAPGKRPVIAKGHVPDRLRLETWLAGRRLLCPGNSPAIAPVVRYGPGVVASGD